MRATNAIIDNFEYSLNFLRDLVADLSAAELVAQSATIKNHPAWVIGHLTFSCQAIGSEIGLDKWLPNDWGARFGMGSTPSPAASDYESKEELLRILGDAQDRIVSAVRALSDEQLQQPLPDENYREDLPTVQHAIGQILVAHTAYHMGQTVIWRRSVGLSKIERPFL